MGGGAGYDVEPDDAAGSDGFDDEVGDGLSGGEVEVGCQWPGAVAVDGDVARCLGLGDRDVDYDGCGAGGDRCGECECEGAECCHGPGGSDVDPGVELSVRCQ